MPRYKSSVAAREGGGAYFSAPSELSFIKSGCTLFDLMVTGGSEGAYPLGRMTNLIGDKSTGKTLLAIEACANFARQFPKGHIWYRETEAAFDQSYAEALGMPVKRINPGEKKWAKFDTVEDVFDDLSEKIEAAKKAGQPCLYVLDSLDALSDKAEMKKKIGDQDFPRKPAKMSELFRKLVRPIEESHTHLLIISQVRTNIGAMFGDKTSRSGGKAMDFYASACIKLAHIAQLSRTIAGEKRVTGVRIKAKCTKNKLALPFRECEFVIRFAYGVANYESTMDWLIARGKTKLMGLSKEAAERLMDQEEDWDQEQYDEQEAKLVAATTQAWREIEREFLP
ncbi:MAG: hypothetical protein KGR26_08105, partial [Cyanobacteria bacterium REEB65]|nr:hypothetical protein [Cyanobacteria bacterium REEB65]